MYNKNNKTYSDAGTILRDGVNLGYYLDEVTDRVKELVIDLTEMELRGPNKEVAVCPTTGASFGTDGTYADIKTRIIKERYSNDDQIAIMLNRDESEERELEYQRMQEWRAWATKVAHKIMELWESSQQS